MAELETFRMLIGGKPSDAASGRTFETQNPFTGAPWATVPDCGPDDVDTAELVEQWRDELFGPDGTLRDKVA